MSETLSEHKNSSGFIEDSFLSGLKNNLIIIDCGHLPLGINNEVLIFGKNGHPSDSERLTLSIGIDLYHRLKSSGKKPKLSICFSDTTRYFIHPSLRPLAKHKCESGEIYSELPEEYKLQLIKIPIEDCFFTLQTVNSNRFTSIIKKVKRDIRLINDDEQSYNKYNALFARDNLNTLFCFTNEFLLETSTEEIILDGDWWLNEFSNLHPSDKVKAPVASLKKFGIISLYSRLTGILCPATYGGLVSNFGNDTDHIAVYSRQDDPSIGEKIIRGIISSCVLSQPQSSNKSFLQVILNSNTSESLSKFSEISFLSSNDVNIKSNKYANLKEIFKKRLSYRYQKYI